MAQRKKDGTWEVETSDYMQRAVRDAVAGRSSSVPGGPATAAQQAAYTEAYTWGQWFKVQLNRSSF